MSYHRRDILWKLEMELMTVPFLRFFYKEADAIFDFNKGYRFLNNELAEINPGMNMEGSKKADALIELHTLNGKTQIVLVHVEVEGGNDKEFSKRLHTYYYRIKDKFKLPVTTLVIYLGKKGKNRPSFYEERFLGTKARLDFNAYYVAEQNEEELRKSKNPFAHIILTALMAIKNKKKPIEQVFASKRALIENLLKADFNPREITILLNFIRLYVSFDTNELNAKFDLEFTHLTKQNITTMNLETMTFEEIHKKFEQVLIEEAEEKGKKIATKKTLLVTAKKMLHDGMNILLVHKYTGLSIKQLNALAKSSR